jgi:hypothetical protein
LFASSESGQNVTNFGEEQSLVEIDQLLQFVAGKDNNAAIYATAAKAYFQNKDGALKDAGVLVVGFEGNRTHSVLRVGDILVTHNGHAVARLEDLAAAPTPAPGFGSKTELLRFNGKWFDRLDVQSKTNDPRFQVAELREAKG